MRLVIAVTCYNRLLFLQEFIDSWKNTKNDNHEWTLIIADDGSSQDQIRYIESIQTNKKIFIRNNRRGISHQTNCIFKELEKIDYDLCFKCDEDIIFKKNGWDDLYASAVLNTNLKHICYDNLKFSQGDWCEEGRLSPPKYLTIKDYNFVAYVKSDFSRGCFYTITKDIQKKIGFMDVYNFFHGYEHTDYYLRCSRLGFCDKNFAFDLKDSHEFISYRHWHENKPCLSTYEYKINGNGVFDSIKKKLMKDTTRVFIPYHETKRKIVNDIILQ